VRTPDLDRYPDLERSWDRRRLIKSAAAGGLIVAFGGVLARFAADGIDAADLRARVATLTTREPLSFDAGPPRVRTLAIVSGAGASYLDEAIAKGADAFLTGEPAERVMTQAREAQVHFIAAGHYATETFGVRRLGEHLAERFGVEQVFIDVPNPV